eukprot:2802304-Rhodomonas_salina.2
MQCASWGEGRWVWHAGSGSLTTAHCPGRGGNDRLQLQCCKDWVVRKKEACAVAMLERHRLDSMISDGSNAVEPGHPKDDAHILQAKDEEGDICLVLLVNLDGECGLVQDGE